MLHLRSACLVKTIEISTGFSAGITHLPTVSYDGKINYTSSTEKIHRENTTLTFEIFPNPVSEELSVVCYPLSGVTEINILNILG